MHKTRDQRHDDDTQLSLFDASPAPEQKAKAPRCHFRGCKEPIVGSSTAKRDGYVCKEHNALEWANALDKSKDGYWKQFGKNWLGEIKNSKLCEHINKQLREA